MRRNNQPKQPLGKRKKNDPFKEDKELSVLHRTAFAPQSRTLSGIPIENVREAVFGFVWGMISHKLHRYLHFNYDSAFQKITSSVLYPEFIMGSISDLAAGCLGFIEQLRKFLHMSSLFETIRRWLTRIKQLRSISKATINYILFH